MHNKLEFLMYYTWHDIVWIISDIAIFLQVMQDKFYIVFTFYIICTVLSSCTKHKVTFKETSSNNTTSTKNIKEESIIYDIEKLSTEKIKQKLHINETTPKDLYKLFGTPYNVYINKDGLIEILYKVYKTSDYITQKRQKKFFNGTLRLTLVFNMEGFLKHYFITRDQSKKDFNNTLRKLSKKVPSTSE